MNATTIAVASKVVRYIKDDLSHKYGLKERAQITITGKGAGAIPPVKVGVLTIEPDGTDRVILTAEPFEANERLWNGPNIIPDDWQDGSMEASLWHDLIWAYLDILAFKTGLSEKYILEWSNGIFAAAWNGYAKLYPEAIGVKAKSWLGYQVVRLGAWFKRLFLIVGLLALASGCDSCQSPPDWETEDTSPIAWEKGE